MLHLTPLCELAKKYQTDKGGRHLHYNGQPNEITHEYTQIYFDLLVGRPVDTVLEIGVNSGASLRMWAEFFPEAKVWGFDIDPACLFEAERISCKQADAGNAESLTAAVKSTNVKEFDLIVDDGSHIPVHQVTSMKTLLPYLAPGGLYVIEDIHHGLVQDIIDQVPDGYAVGAMWSKPVTPLRHRQVWEPLVFITKGGAD